MDYDLDDDDTDDDGRQGAGSEFVLFFILS